jgi:hypothetical protein
MAAVPPQDMEASSLLRGERDEAASSPAPRVGRSTKLAVATVACFAAGIVAWRSSSSSTAATSAASSPTVVETAELYSKKELYGPDYGALVGGAGSDLQKAWPGLTCDRSDDDKWGWGADPMKQPLDSGTNCVWGDTWFCTDHYDVNASSGRMSEISQLMWNKCNSTCNSTDEDRVMANGVDAHLVGSSGLAACQFQGVKDMKEVCTGLPSDFTAESSRRYLIAKSEVPEQRRLKAEQGRRMTNVAPSVPERYMADIQINASWGFSQEACNTHGLCATCVEDGEMNAYCEALMIYYGGSTMFWYQGYLSDLFWYVDSNSNSCRKISTNTTHPSSNTNMNITGTTCISGA